MKKGDFLIITVGAGEFTKLHPDDLSSWDTPLVGIGDGSPRGASFVSSAIVGPDEIITYKVDQVDRVVEALVRMRELTPEMKTAKTD